jgi:hypothetical protein
MTYLIPVGSMCRIIMPDWFQIDYWSTIHTIFDEIQHSLFGTALKIDILHTCARVVPDRLPVNDVCTIRTPSHALHPERRTISGERINTEGRERELKPNIFHRNTELKRKGCHTKEAKDKENENPTPLTIKKRTIVGSTNLIQTTHRICVVMSVLARVF